MKLIKINIPYKLHYIKYINTYISSSKCREKVVCNIIYYIIKIFINLINNIKKIFDLIIIKITKISRNIEVVSVSEGVTVQESPPSSSLPNYTIVIRIDVAW